MGAGAFNLICSKYICEKYGYKLVRSGSLSKQSSQVQKKVKEMLKQGDLGYLKYRKWYTTTGHNYLNAGPGTANNIELYLQYYKSVNGQLPYFYDDDNKNNDNYNSRSRKVESNNNSKSPYEGSPIKK